jgi:hypothetical protein
MPYFLDFFGSPPYFTACFHRDRYSFVVPKGTPSSANEIAHRGRFVLSPHPDPLPPGEGGTREAGG